MHYTKVVINTANFCLIRHQAWGCNKVANIYIITNVLQSRDNLEDGLGLNKVGYIIVSRLNITYGIINRVNRRFHVHSKNESVTGTTL